MLGADLHQTADQGNRSPQPAGTDVVQGLVCVLAVLNDHS